MNWQSLIRDPALLNGLVRAVFLVVVSLGVSVTQDQQDATLTLIGAVIAVIGSLALTAVTVSKTTPKANPTIEQGTIVTVATPEGQPNYPVKL